MTEQEQQAVMVRYLPLCKGIANAICHNDDEYEGIAILAMCEAVKSHDPSAVNGSLDKWVEMKIRNAVTHYLRRVKFERSLGTSGGAPAADCFDSGSSGRRHMHKDPIERNPRRPQVLDKLVASRPEHEMDTTEEILELIPVNIRPIARARWIERKSLAEISKEFGIPNRTLKRRLYDAREFVRLYLDS